MRFAKIVFSLAGVWGVVVLTPLFFLFDMVGSQYPPPITHPDFYFGFITTALAWQAAFLVIGTDPMRFRPLMVPAMFEKFAFVAVLVLLYAGGSVRPGQAMVAVPDFLLGLFFVAAFVKTR
jgi:hypothetical protein